MQKIKCLRCGNEAAPPEFVPYGGALKEAIVGSTCGECWEAWKKMSVMVINEFKLTPFMPQHKEILEQHLKEFLKLENV